MNTRGPYKRKYPLDATERTCRLCKETKPVTDFTPNIIRENGYVSIESRCNECRKPIKASLRRQTVYGLSDQEFKEMKDAQGNRCLICTNEFTKTPHIDHCHDTGKVRGLLCGDCNTGIGLLREDVANLHRAITYLT